MKTFEDISVRVFPVRITDMRTGDHSNDSIAITKAKLQAAQQVGMSSWELIEKEYARQGFRVDGVGKAQKITIIVDLMDACTARGRDL